MKKNIVLALGLISLLMFLQIPLAFATETSLDTAGNIFSGESAVSMEKIERDFYWAGSDLTLSNKEIGQDGIMAGKTLSVSDSAFGGGFRSASKDLILSNVKISSNITSTGEIIQINQGTVARGVYLFGRTVSFSGECNALSIGAETVTLNGTVNGDVNIAAKTVILDGIINGNANIDAQTIEVKNNAKVTGAFKVSADSEPAIPATASIDNMQFTKPEITAQGNKPSFFEVLVKKVFSQFYWIVAMTIVTLLLSLVANKTTRASVEMLQSKPAILFVSGLVTLFAIPFLIIALLITAIGAPTAGLIALVSLTATFFAVPFAGAAVGQLIFPSMRKWLASFLGTAILVSLQIVPYLDSLIALASICFTFGYFIQVCYANIKELRPRREPEMPALIEQGAEINNLNSSD